MKGANYFLIKLDKPLQDEILLSGGLRLFLAADYDHSWNVTVTGEVAFEPENPKEKHKYIQVGDSVAISYQIVNDRKFTADSQIFRMEQDYPEWKQYYNGKGEYIKIIKLAKRHGGHYAGVYYNKRHELIDGAEGTESDVNRWLAQFPMSNSKDFVYENLVEINGMAYWKVKKEQIFAKKIKKKLFSCSEFVICEPLVVDLTERISIMKGLHLAPKSILTRYTDRGKVVTGGKDLGIERDEIVGFEPEYVNKYRLFDKDYFLIKQSRINVKWIST